MYQATLVADDSPWDRFMDGDPEAIDELAVVGADLFRSQTRGRCINCHEGAELTGASVRRVRESPVRIREGQALDRGFNNIAVRPTLEDPGVGGNDSLGNPLSTVRALDPPPAEPIAVDGAMKVPGLRNVELTAPYFHNGGFLTLAQVLEFYSRGGDVRPQHSLDGSLEIAPLNILTNTPGELLALEAFLRALTDERVRYRRAPFDHPELFVPDGHPGDGGHVLDDGRGTALDRLRRIPPVGRRGGPPLPGFLE
jgi:cytochrome c peroxidase